MGASGGGCSTLYAPKGWQTNVAAYGGLGCNGKRSVGDVAAVADPYTGFDIYLTFGGSGWTTIGGTSLAAPVVAALWADAGGGGGTAYPALSLYGHFTQNPSSVHDIVLGGNGLCGTSTPASCASSTGGNPNTLGAGKVDCAFGAAGTAVLTNRYQCAARPGYDGPTGVGTPAGPTVFKAMSPTAAFTFPGTITHGVSAQFDGSASTDPFPGGVITTYTWHWGDGTADTVSATPIANHTFATAGASTGVTLKVTDSYSRVNSLTRAITVG
jgi:hypothetical protein